MTKAQKTEQLEAITQLREWLAPGDTVYTILRHVSKSGMSREIGIVVLKDGTALHPNWSVARALDMRQGKRDGIIIGGCGMDMGFAIVYDLSRTLFPDGFGIEGTRPDGSKVRPETPEHAASCVAAGVVFSGRNRDTSGWDNDGGYALNQRWL